jgi:hypothetical protein
VPHEKLFEELLAFYEQHGHHHVPNIAKTRGLYAWTEQVREEARLGELPARLKQKLEALDFPFDETALTWERSFASVAATVKRRKRLPPASTPVGAWIRGQLALADLGALERGRTARLRELTRECRETTE